MAENTLTTLSLAHLPAEYRVHIGLYTSVTNASFLRDQLLAGNGAFEFAFVDAAYILSPTHLLSAIFRAANDYSAGRLRTRNVHSEIVFALGGSSNIASNLKTFGISPSSSSIIAVKVTSTSTSTSTTPDAATQPSPPAALLSTLSASEISAFLAAQIHGTQIPFCAESFEKVRDVAAVRKVYKLPVSGSQGKKKGAREVEMEGEGVRELEVQVLALLALRGA